MCHPTTPAPVTHEGPIIPAKAMEAAQQPGRLEEGRVEVSIAINYTIRFGPVAMESPGSARSAMTP